MERNSCVTAGRQPSTLSEVYTVSAPSRKPAWRRRQMLLFSGQPSKPWQRSAPGATAEAIRPA